MEIYEEKKDEEPRENIIINNTFLNKYYCTKKIGKGKYSSIYKAEYEGKNYALKIEDINAGVKFLKKEAEILKLLKGPGIPAFIEYDSTPYYNILVLQLLGKDLKCLNSENDTFSLKTVCMLGYQMISNLEYIHEKNYVHRDIKPENFAMGLGHLSDKVYLIDFDIAKQYRSSDTLVHFPLAKRDTFVGNHLFASINALDGYEYSRRDDLESLGYMFVFLLKGKLPWQGIKDKVKEERNKKILQKKLEISSHNLCQGLPNEFEQYLEYTKKLEHAENPDYNMLKELLLSLLKRKGKKLDYIYEWTTPEEIKKRKAFKAKLNEDKQKENISVNNIENNIEINKDKDKLVDKEKKGVKRNTIKKTRIERSKIIGFSQKGGGGCCNNGCIIF